MIRICLILLFTLLGLCFNFDATAQGSLVFDNLSMKSEILGKEKHFSLYLPPGYDYSERTYPVVYLLHGGTSRPLKHRTWVQHGDIQRIADELILSGSIAPMIIVMPDAEMTYYMNNVNGDYQFEEFFTAELIPYIEKNYRSRTEKRYRAIAGLSMGGYGALLYSLHHPSLFTACASLSAAVRTNQQIIEMPHDQYLRRYGRAVGDVKENSERITDFWNSNSILYLIKHLPEEQKEQVRIYLDIGDDDFLYMGNSLMHISMRELNISHEYRVREGGHNWEYWRSGLEDALKFISADFR